jgi:hypothetical protein
MLKDVIEAIEAPFSISFGACILQRGENVQRF